MVKSSHLKSSHWNEVLESLHAIENTLGEAFESISPYYLIDDCYNKLRKVISLFESIKITSSMDIMKPMHVLMFF